MSYGFVIYIHEFKLVFLAVQMWSYTLPLYNFQAVSLRFAEQYIQAFSNIAKEVNK